MGCIVSAKIGLCQAKPIDFHTQLAGTPATLYRFVTMLRRL